VTKRVDVHAVERDPALAERERIIAWLRGPRVPLLGLLPIVRDAVCFVLRQCADAIERGEHLRTDGEHLK